MLKLFQLRISETIIILKHLKYSGPFLKGAQVQVKFFVSYIFLKTKKKYKSRCGPFYKDVVRGANILGILIQ